MAPPSFVQEHVPSHAALLARPHVTLTWAQSLDSKIAGLGGKRVVLSGPESMLMTHQSVLPPRSLQLAHPPPPPSLRAIHDAILVGVHTLLLDDPRLQSILPLSPLHPALTLH